MKENVLDIKEKCIIVGVYLSSVPNEQFTDEMDELAKLCYACEMEAVDRVVQNLDRINAVTYLGKGKLDELKVIIDEQGIDIVVFNDELTPTQIANIEKKLQVAVYDRTYVILEIFKRRAQTKEAILQVEIASLKYMLPRLVGLHRDLSRQRGSGGGFAHGRGAGETKLELDRRLINTRLALLQKELSELKKLRKQQRTLRKKTDAKVVCLVGYTNSGKSTTLNAILAKSKGIKKEVLEKDMLFATLETSTRMVEVPSGKFLITDTVGFVNKLPHQLVEAFKSTLEEIKEADLIVHVVDSSNPNFTNQIQVTNGVLHEIGIDNIPVIYAFNKMDLVVGYLLIPDQFEKVMRFSAKTGGGLNDLIDEIIDTLYEDYLYLDINLTYQEYEQLRPLLQTAIMTQTNYSDDGVNLKGKVPPHIYQKITNSKTIE